jgi:hypothetical protein
MKEIIQNHNLALKSATASWLLQTPLFQSRRSPPFQDIFPSLEQEGSERTQDLSLTSHHKQYKTQTEHKAHIHSVGVYPSGATEPGEVILTELPHFNG